MMYVIGNVKCDNLRLNMIWKPFNNWLILKCEKCYITYYSICVTQSIQSIQYTKLNEYEPAPSI